MSSDYLIIASFIVIGLNIYLAPVTSRGKNIFSFITAFLALTLGILNVFE